MSEQLQLVIAWAGTGEIVRDQTIQCGERLDLQLPVPVQKIGLYRALEPEPTILLILTPDGADKTEPGHKDAPK